MAGLILNKVSPQYPIEAKQSGVQGTVVLHAVIGKDGSVEKVEAVSGSEMLVPAAIDAVRQWTYKPYLLNGQRMEVDTTITVNFSLAEQPRTIRVSSSVAEGLRLTSVPPSPPSIRTNGDVEMHVMIGTDGRVKSVDAVSGPLNLRQVCIEAVRKWTYKPALMNGKPVELDTSVTIHFTN